MPERLSRLPQPGILGHPARTPDEHGRHSEGFAELAQAIKEKSRKTIWCYTGYTFERLLSNPQQRKLLEHIDVLVDGRFRQELRDENLCFRGSSNQRLIDVPASLRAKKAITYPYQP